MSFRSEGMLEGVRVLDLTRVVAGPTCTRALADLGAEVIKVEPPKGDLLRKGVPRIGGVAVIFTQQNAGKRLVSIDLDRPGGVRLLLSLAAQCEIFVENFRGGVADRLGIGYEAICEVRSDVIYCSISGYGQTGPAAHRRAYAPIVHAESGLIHYKAVQRDTAPLPEPVSHADIAVGLQAAQGILAALYHRERTGEGTFIDACMIEAMISANEWSSAEINGGTDWNQSIFRPGKAALVQVADGTWVQLPGSPASTLPKLARVAGREDILQDERFRSLHACNTNLDACVQVLRELAADYSDFESLERALSEGARIPVGRIVTLAEVVEADWAVARDSFVEVPSGESGETVTINRGALRFSNASYGARGGSGSLGSNNREILREILGYSDIEIDRLEQEGVLVTG